MQKEDEFGSVYQLEILTVLYIHGSIILDKFPKQPTELQQKDHFKMNRQKFVTCISNLHPFEAVRLVFKSNGIPGLSHIYRLCLDDGAIRVGGRDQLGEVQKIVFSKVWGGQSKTFSFVGLCQINEFSLAIIADHVDSIRTVRQHFVSPFIDTVHLREQGDVAYNLIRSVLSEDFVFGEIAGLGATIDGRFTTVDGQPIFEFTVRSMVDYTTVLRLCVNGWSGRFTVDDTPSDYRFRDAEAVREQIRSSLAEVLTTTSTV